MKTPYRHTVAIFLVAAVAGCSMWNPEEAPAGFAAIREHVITASRNDPPISSTLDFTILEIDGKSPTRETIPPWVDLEPGALVSAGSHEFKAMVLPHARRPDHRPTEVIFTATVQSTKVYDLVDKDGRPVLIEAKSAQK